MQTSRPETPARIGPDITDQAAIRDHLRTYTPQHSRPQVTQYFCVSRHTLWHCLERGHLGHSLPDAVTKAAGDARDTVAAAGWGMTASRQVR